MSNRINLSRSPLPIPNPAQKSGPKKRGAARPSSQIERTFENSPRKSRAVTSPWTLRRSRIPLYTKMSFDIFLNGHYCPHCKISQFVFRFVKKNQGRFLRPDISAIYISKRVKRLFFLLLLRGGESSQWVGDPPLFSPIGDGAAMITLVLGSAAEQCTTCTEFDKHKHIKKC